MHRDGVWGLFTLIQAFLASGVDSRAHGLSSAILLVHFLYLFFPHTGGLATSIHLLAVKEGVMLAYM